MLFSDSEYFSVLANTFFRYLYRNYDLCFLRAMHNKNAMQGADTIIVGSSHAMYGINEYELNSTGNTINFSVQSQDLFFDYLNIKKAFSEGKTRIRRCLIGLGYYMLYQDESRSPLLKHLISDVYMNIFGDEGKHNYVDAVKKDPFSAISFDEKYYPEALFRDWCEFWSNSVMLEKGTYFNDIYKRYDNNMLGMYKVDWNLLSSVEKDDFAKERTVNGHNKNITHTESRMENQIILKDMVKYLYDRGIVPVFFITPYTRYYMQYISSEFKPDLYNTLDALDYPIEFLDMNDYGDEFSDEDFLDSDHLSDSGAKKATAILNSFIKLIDE